MITFADCFKMIRRLRDCAELCQDNLEAETQELLDEVYDFLASVHEDEDR